MVLRKPVIGLETANYQMDLVLWLFSVRSEDEQIFGQRARSASSRKSVASVVIVVFGSVSSMSI